MAGLGGGSYAVVGILLCLLSPAFMTSDLTLTPKLYFDLLSPSRVILQQVDF